MICKKCKKEFKCGDICPHYRTDNHNYSMDWIMACDETIN